MMLCKNLCFDDTLVVTQSPNLISTVPRGVVSTIKGIATGHHKKKEKKKEDKIS